MAEDNQEQKEKPLEKMTATELRDTAKEISEITGASGMNKVELISAIKKARGIEDDTLKKSGASNREIKAKIKELKVKRQEALSSDDRKTATILKRRISRLKKKSRKAA